MSENAWKGKGGGKGRGTFIQISVGPAPRPRSSKELRHAVSSGPVRTLPRPVLISRPDEVVRSRGLVGVHPILVIL